METAKLQKELQSLLGDRFSTLDSKKSKKLFLNSSAVFGDFIILKLIRLFYDKK